MIDIKSIGIYDPTKGFFEQDEPVNTYLNNIISTFNDFTAVQRDEWDRPTYWVYKDKGVVLESRRHYNTQDGNYSLKLQTFNLQKDGSI